jgi:hypothetical protein
MRVRLARSRRRSSLTILRNSAQGSDAPNFQTSVSSTVKSAGYIVRIVKRLISGGKTHQVPSSCRKKNIPTGPAGRSTSTRTKRFWFERARQNWVTRAGVEGVGASHFSTSKRKDPSAAIILFSSGMFRLLGSVHSHPAQHSIVEGKSQFSFATRTR